MNVTVGRSSIAVIRISEQSRTEQDVTGFKKKNVTVEITAVR